MLLGLFAWAQLASNVHAADHAFHEQNELCASFIQVENNPLEDLAEKPVTVTFFKDEWTFDDTIQSIQSSPANYRARAPPTTI